MIAHVVELHCQLTYVFRSRRLSGLLQSDKRSGNRQPQPNCLGCFGRYAPLVRKPTIEFLLGHSTNFRKLGYVLARNWSLTTSKARQMGGGNSHFLRQRLASEVGDLLGQIDRVFNHAASLLPAPVTCKIER